MNVTLPKSALVDAITVASTAIDNDHPQPILASVKATVAPGTVLFTGSDLSTTAMARAAADTANTQEFVANARTMVERCKLMPDGPVTLKLETANTLVITGGTRRFTMAIRDVADYPKTDARDAKGPSLSVAALASIIDRGGMAMSKEKGRPAIQTCISLRTDDGWTEVGAANSSYASCDAIETGLPNHAPVLIPTRGVEILRKFIAGKGTVQFEVDADRGWLYATRDETRSLAVRLADPNVQPYRAFREATEKVKANTITVIRGFALDTVRAITAVCEMGQVEVSAGHGRFIVKGRSDTGELAEDEMMAETDDGPVATIMSGLVLSQVLSLASSERVTIRVANDGHPIIVREVGGNESRAWWLLMPVRPSSYEERPVKKAKVK